MAGGLAPGPAHDVRPDHQRQLRPGEGPGYIGLPVRDVLMRCTVNGLVPAMETPFLIFSGRTAEDPGLDPVFRLGVWLNKPAPPERIVAAIRDALSSKGTDGLG